MTPKEQAEKLSPCAGKEAGYIQCVRGVSNVCLPCLNRPGIAAALDEKDKKIIMANRAIQSLLYLASVPERDQDEDWYAEYQKIADEWKDDICPQQKSRRKRCCH